MFLQIMEDDLRKRGVLDASTPRPPNFEFALMLMEEYVKYPVDNLNNAWFPYNYCMLPHVAPIGPLRDMLQTAIDFVC